jgi:hypothetical protein
MLRCGMLAARSGIRGLVVSEQLIAMADEVIE